MLYYESRHTRNHFRAFASSEHQYQPVRPQCLIRSFTGRHVIVLAYWKYLRFGYARRLTIQIQQYFRPFDFRQRHFIYNDLHHNGHVTSNKEHRPVLRHFPSTLLYDAKRSVRQVVTIHHIFVRHLHDTMANREMIVQSNFSMYMLLFCIVDPR